ncbi:hypothetical protein ARMSODRAFT_1089927 [Armillaria solidipes]|uniref:Six-hairpin glycosidase n=1 Tax=Armillaria solidipes TaxID=1076256 RepID=A0A2H3BDE8_9AGAR|nr:hypothetical protein ARMSODRAFT_1089927 [Armillaria solidipes]
MSSPLKSCVGQNAIALEFHVLNIPRTLSLPGVRMRLVFISTLFALSSYSVAAQELKPSADWRSPIITLSKDDRISIADYALQEAISMLNKTNGQFSDGRYDAAGAHYAQIPEFDRLTNQTTYKDTLKNYFKLAESVKPGFLDDKNYGYAAARAYTVYGDQYFLDIAQTSWTSARRYTISPEQAASGTIETKQFNLTSSCNATLAGGTYLSTDPNDSSLDSLASGVSALLAEATFNQMYIDAAIESANFIQSNLLTQSNIVWGTIESSSNQTSSCSLIPVVTPHGSGSFIEGLVILVGIPHNISMESLLRSVISAVTTDLMWQGADGVYYCLDSGGHYIVRGLASLYERNTTSSDLREYIKEYIGVQYNAVIELARSSNASAIYGLAWTGPPGTSFDGVLQLSALTVLLGAIQLVDGPSSNSSASSVIPTSSVSVSPPPQSSSGSAVASSAKKDSARIIAGSVVGGIVLLAALIVGTLFLRKLRRQRNDSPLVVDGSSPMLIPFTTTQNMASSGILAEQHRRNQVKSARFPGVAMGGEPSSSGDADNGSVGMVRTEPTASPRNQAASPENSPPGDRREHTLLEELLRSLNDRMSRDRWNAEELPPDYHEGQAM